MSRRCTTVLALGAAILIAGTARAADPVGTWTTADAEATVQIAPCGGALLCGRIAALREPREPATGRPKTDDRNPDARLRRRPLVGVQIVVRMAPTGRPGQWAGHVYNPEDGGVHPATLTLLSARALRLDGCIIKDVLCLGQTWTRAR